MSAQTLPLLPYGILATLLLFAMASDIRSREIGNWTNLFIALGAPVAWWFAGLSLWPDVAMQLGIALGFFCLFTIFWSLNAMGGGDVKLIGALSLWFPLLLTIRLLLIMSIIGGALTVAIWAWRKLKKSHEKGQIPYGVAISAAGLWAIYERNFNHFG
jgi:prepilin peptidase CpaA